MGRHGFLPNAIHGFLTAFLIGAFTVAIFTEPPTPLYLVLWSLLGMGMLDSAQSIVRGWWHRRHCDCGPMTFASREEAEAYLAAMPKEEGYRYEIEESRE